MGRRGRGIVLYGQGPMYGWAFYAQDHTKVGYYFHCPGSGMRNTATKKDDVERKVSARTHGKKEMRDAAKTGKEEGSGKSARTSPSRKKFNVISRESAQPWPRHWEVMV